MSHRRAKDSAKIFISDRVLLQKIVLKTLREASDIVASTLGPGGRNTLIESSFPGIPHKNTKDGVTVLSSLGAQDPFEHLILEQLRDVAKKTADSTGDGTTTATLLAYCIVSNMFDFCDKNPKYSPQRAARRIQKVIEQILLPFIESKTIKITEDNQQLLKMVATVSTNGDVDMASAVIDAFEAIGYGDSSHVTIRELSGRKAYKVERIDGFPIPMGFEESIGKLHTAFINDTANQRCFLEKPLFLLYDGNVNDLMAFLPLMENLGSKYVNEGNSDFKNLVIFAHGYSENVLTQLAFNFSNPNTLNVLPMITPIQQFLNSQTHFMHDLAAFTGAKVFGLKDQVHQATLSDLGRGMENFEAYRFRSTVVGDPDPVNVELRADELKTMMISAEGAAEKILLEERIGKITNGIAKLTIYGGSNGELKEAHDRCEDAVCAVRSTISHGAVPGGCRLAIDMALKLQQELPDGDPAKEVLLPSLMALPMKLLDNAGYRDGQGEEVVEKLIEEVDMVYDIENELFGKAEELGLFDASKAVSESLSNAVSIACILGTMGGIVAFPRDPVFERSEARADADYGRATEHPESFNNEADERA